MVRPVKLEQLEAFFPPARHDDIEALYRRYLRERRLEEDVEGFIIYLYDEGLLAPDALRDILAHHEVTLGSVPDLDAREGTPYRIVSPLGEGAMGEVFLARDPNLKRTVALKRIKAAVRSRAAIVQRFVTEAQITAQLDHPAIIPIYGIQVDDEGRIAYAMKFVRGKTFKDYIKESREFFEQGQLPDEDHSLKARIEAFLPVLAAMDYSHRRGIIHRDLKPENIMLGAFGEVMVMDWGIARPIGRRERVTTGTNVENTRAGTLIGTPYYMSPEQARGLTDQLDDKSDQYSLGLILHELVTLARALSGDTQLEVVTRAASAMRAPVVHAYGKEKIPRELIAIIDRATAKDPDARYPNVDAMGDDLRRFLRDESVHADPDKGLRKAKRWVGRHRGLTMSLTLGLAALVVVVAVFLQWRGTVALQEEREASFAREQQMQVLTNRVNNQAARMTADLSRFERIVHGIATVAEKVLTEPPTAAEDPIAYRYFTDTMEPREPPASARPAKTYGGDAISVEEADYVVAHTADPGALGERLRQLAGLERTLKKAVLSSHSNRAPYLPEGEQRRLITEQGIPLVWAYVATEDGVSLGYPGTWSMPTTGTGYDVRDMEWYRTFTRPDAISCSTAGLDESGLGILMTCAQKLFGADGRLLGIAAVDMTLKYFIDTLLDHPVLASRGAEAFIIDPIGQVIVRSSQKDEARDATTWKIKLLDDAPLLAAIKENESGHVTRDDGKLAVWSRVGTVAWTYLVVGDPDALLDSADLADAPTTP